MVRDTSQAFTEEDATLGTRLLFLSGDDLANELEAGGLLQMHDCIDGIKRRCTIPARVRAVFHALCYVIISKNGKYYPACRRGHICTCMWFCRYARCEHHRFAIMLNLRLLPGGETIFGFCLHLPTPDNSVEPLI